MTFKFANAASATIAASITSASLSLTVTTGLGALFPTLTAGQKFTAVIVDSSNNYEFITVTARTGDSMAITRAQEGTIARSFSSGSRVELRMTAAALNNFPQLDGAQTFSGANTFSGASTFSGSTTFSGAIDVQGGGTLGGTLSGSPILSGNPNFTGTALFSNGAQFTASLLGDTTSDVWFKGAFRTTSAYLGANSTVLYEPATNALGVRVGPSSAYRYFTFAANGDFSMQGAFVTTGNITTSGSIGASGNIGATGSLSAGGNITTSGNITASGDITAFSDERLKTDWQPLQAGFVEHLAQLKSGSFLRTDIQKFQIGVGAQGLQKFLPLAVYQENDGYLSVNYGAAAMVSAVELAKRLIEVEARVAALES